jgi:hypothetical protein
MIGTLLQIVGLAAVTIGAILGFGAAGGVVGAGVGAVYVGLAMERD